MAVLVRNEVADALVTRSAKVSQVITAKKAAPRTAPCHRSVFVAARSFFQKITASTANARQNRTASRFSGVKLFRPILANSSEVLLAKITAASRHSACLRLMADPTSRYGHFY